ncbi:ParB/RepB/Spo0J family partition protein [Oleidesulfovibrio sp.]|uniref:ParB/RepB/Spo0J family partition protein n=1 Tax=Oleidesulfovibrio sp. TaxID=2909707 RepID=UPI003A83B996
MHIDEVKLIPIEEINILNPRVRNQIIAEEIRQNILNVGLKRPITVTLRGKRNGKMYDLVCGQGRLEAYIAAGEDEIPAIIREVSREEAHLMSLVENIARRSSNALELLQSIKLLRERGYSNSDIARKTNLGKNYIQGIIRLLDQGEEYLVSAVEKGRVPLYQAIMIATERDSDVQKALAGAYESGELSGKKFKEIQKIVTRRKHYGKGKYAPIRPSNKISAEELIAAYERESKEKKQLVAQSYYIKQALTYTTSALSMLLEDVHFRNQLKAVGMHDIPKNILGILDR